MLWHIQHETRLSYSEPVSETVLEVRMAPPPTEDQTTLGYRLHITPQATVTPYRDGFGNRVDLFNLLTPYRELVVRATSFVQTHRRPGQCRLAEVPYQPEQPSALEALEYQWPSRLVDRCPALDAFVADLGTPSGSLADVVGRVLRASRDRLKYEKRVTTARTKLSEALGLGRGVCQDIAHLMIGACRRLGVPARYVSGYIHQAGEIATHAWCQVWGGPAGWVEVDPTMGVFADAHHVLIGVGRDYSDVPPNRGVWKGAAEETITVLVKVEPIDRLPPDWADLNGQASWSGNAHSQTQRGVPGRKKPQLGSHRTLYRHQQSQQQQSARAGRR